MYMTKKLNGVLLVIALLPTALFAHVFSMTPTVPLPTQIYASSIATGRYTITNIASQVSFTAIDQSLFPANSGLSILSDTCGGLLAPGQSCNIDVQLAPTMAQRILAAVRVWAKPSADGVQSPLDINVVAIPQSLFVIFGGNVISPSFFQSPLIGISQDSGASWSQQTFAQPEGFTESGISNIDCVNDFCAASGFGINNSVEVPLVGFSNNHGSSWQLKKLAVSEFGANLFDVSCTTTKNCTAVGLVVALNTFQVTPYSAITADGGVTWTQRSLTVLSPYTSGQFNGVNCIGNSCVAVGSVGNNVDSFPLIGVSNDNGVTWTQQVINPVSGGFTDGILQKVYCNGINCLAAGFYYDNSVTQPVVLQSPDHGNSWVAHILPLPTSYVFGRLDNVTCFGNHCVAVGQFTFSPGYTTHAGVATSGDGGTTWAIQALDLPSGAVSSALSHIKCTGSTCIAGGSINTNNSGDKAALVAVSHDYGVTWTQQVLAVPSGYQSSAFAPPIFI